MKWFFSSVLMGVLLAPFSVVAPGPPVTEALVPEDFVVGYKWVAGSMPPPHHFEYRIQIRATGEGEMVLWPDYPGVGTPEWKESFVLPAHQISQLYQFLSDRGLLATRWSERDQPPVGGSYDWIEITVNGRQLKTPPFVVSSQEERLEACYSAIRDLVPKAVREELQRKRERYAKEYEGR